MCGWCVAAIASRAMAAGLPAESVIWISFDLGLMKAMKAVLPACPAYYVVSQSKVSHSLGGHRLLLFLRVLRCRALHLVRILRSVVEPDPRPPWLCPWLCPWL